MRSRSAPHCQRGVSFGALAALLPTPVFYAAGPRRAGLAEGGNPTSLICSDHLVRSSPQPCHESLYSGGVDLVPPDAVVLQRAGDDDSIDDAKDIVGVIGRDAATDQRR
jgi:hypothetical protein